jgi:hypothetical protein
MTGRALTLARRISWLAGGLAILALPGCGGGRPVQALPSPAAALPEQSADPALAIDPDAGDVLMAWLGGDSTGWTLRVSRSKDGGRSWSSPVAITPPAEPVHPHGESSPRILAATGGRVAVVWSTSWEVPGREWPASNVRFSRSMDGGRTWSAPVTLNDDTTAAPGSHAFHGASLAGDSGIVVAWLDERAPRAPAASDSGADDASIYQVRSPDFGGRWEPNRPGSGAACPCCRVQVAGNAAGDAIAAWRNHAPGQIRDIVVGDLAADAAPVHADGWRFSGCPHSGPSVVLDPDGARQIAWYTGADGRSGVYYARQSAGGPFSAPVAVARGANLPTAHVSLAVSRRLGPVVAWDVTAEKKRRIAVARIADPGVTVERAIEIPESDGALYPQIVPLEDRPATVVAWTQSGAGHRRVRVAAIDWR